MKRLLCILLALALAAALLSCGRNLTPSAYEASDFDTSGEVVLTTQYPNYDKSVESFTYYVTNNTEEDLTFSADYSVEVLQGDTWMELPASGGTAAGNSEKTIEARPGETVSGSFSFWQYPDYTVEDGTYRIVKEIGGRLCCAEFVIGIVETTVDNPYGYGPLEDLPEELGPEELDCDLVIDESGAIIGGSEERVLDFLEKVADGTPTMLRMVSYTLSGQPVVHDITFESRHFLYRRDDTRSGGSITQQRYSYLVADGSYIYLSDYADLSYRENPDRTLEAQILAVFTASSFSDWDSFRGVVEDMTASRLESDATMARYWSEDGAHWVNLTADPMDYTVTSEKYGMSRTLTQFDGLVDGGVEILSAQWLSDTQVQLNCRIEGQEGLYYAVFDLGAEQVISVGK